MKLQPFPGCPRKFSSPVPCGHASHRGMSASGIPLSLCVRPGNNSSNIIWRESPILNGDVPRRPPHETEITGCDTISLSQQRKLGKWWRIEAFKFHINLLCNTYLFSYFFVAFTDKSDMDLLLCRNSYLVNGLLTATQLQWGGRRDSARFRAVRLIAKRVDFNPMNASQHWFLETRRAWSPWWLYMNCTVWLTTWFSPWSGIRAR